MNACPCCDEKDLTPQSLRPRLFNWMTVLLVTGWVVLVAIIAEVSGPAVDVNDRDARAFVESLTR